MYYVSIFNASFALIPPLVLNST